MKVTKGERLRAEQVSAAIDRRIGVPGADPGQVAPDDAGLLATADQLARLPSLLGPVDAVFEQRVMARVRAGARPARRLPRFRPSWAVAGLAAILLLAALLTPQGQTAMASFMAVFNLGRTEVSITPVYERATPGATAAAQTAAIQEDLTLEQAQAQLPFALPQPAYLPTGYQMQGVRSYTFPDLPPWVPQPLFAELVYHDDQGQRLTLRVYPIMLSEEANISGLNLKATSIRDTQPIDVNGQPGVLLQLDTGGAGDGWQEAVWEHEDLILALSATNLRESELLAVARSVR
jgi:AcrR family transcriptional regulator